MQDVPRLMGYPVDAEVVRRRNFERAAAHTRRRARRQRRKRFGWPF